MALKVGDRVKVKSGKEHDTMTKGKVGTVQEVSTPALGIKFDGMAEMHKWYVDEEVEKQNGRPKPLMESAAVGGDDKYPEDSKSFVSSIKSR